MYTQTFSNLSHKNVDIAGGKGASLGELLSANIPVPDGFVVLSGSFESFLHQTGIAQEVEALLKKVDTDVVSSIDSVSEQIQYLIKGSTMPEEIRNEILQQYKDTGSEFVAVRSSATAEDGAEHAWAGQLSSHLNVTKQSLIERVQDCWASLFTPRAIFYRFEKGLQEEQISVAVVVQKMVNSEKSGVAFSVHPVTQDSNQIIIEAGFGLGEAIVSGDITPDSYVFHKKENEIVEVSVNRQITGLFRSVHDSEEGMNEWRNLSEEEAGQQVLSDSEILELATLIQRVEDHYGFPCDIEWAFEDGEFYLTQSRPITTLGYEQIAQPEMFEKVWEAGNAPVFEMTHGTMLAYPVQKEIGLVDTRMSVVGTEERVSAYYSLESLQQAGKDGAVFFRKNSTQFLEVADSLIKRSAEYVKLHDGQPASIESFRDTSYLLRKVFAYFNTTNPQFTAHIESGVQNEIQAVVEESADEVFRDMCVSEKVSLIQEEQIAWMQLVTATQKEPGNRNVFVQAHFETYKYLIGDEGNEKVSEDSFQILLEKELREEVDYTEELEKFATYTQDSLEKKTQHIATYQLSKSIQYDAHILSEIGHVRLELRSAWTALFHLIRAQLEKVVQDYNLDPAVIRSYAADEIVEYITAEKEFATRSDYFSVDISEGDCTLSFGSDASTSDSFSVQSSIETDGVSVRGNVAFPGKVQGKAVVIEWGSDDFSQKLDSFPVGAILIAGQTRPMLVPAIKKAAAIVTDEGGITSHAAIVAREFQKPCVIGTKLATEFFNDGDMVEVDAHTGLVSRLSK